MPCLGLAGHSGWQIRLKPGSKQKDKDLFFSPHNAKSMQAAVLGQSSRTLKYMSVRIIIDENKIVNPKFAKLNFASKPYDLDVL